MRGIFSFIYLLNILAIDYLSFNENRGYISAVYWSQRPLLNRIVRVSIVEDNF